MKNKNIIILTGAGISQESGIQTFRDANGLWNNYDIMEVASPQGWHKHPDVVLEFYNLRRRQLHKVRPNKGHLAINRLQKHFNVHVITQNVDDLHERAGNTNVLHLHGELFKVRSTCNENLIYDWKKDLHLGDLADDGCQLRPHIVWFGEPVPMIEKAMKIVQIADVLIIVGTGMQVYPAAGLIHYLSKQTPIYYIDPKPAAVHTDNPLYIIPKKAGVGVPETVDELIEKYNSKK